MSRHGSARSRPSRLRAAGCLLGTALFLSASIASAAAAEPLPPLPAGTGFERLAVPGYLSSVVAWPAVPAASKLPIAVATHGSYDQPEWNCQTYQQVAHGAAVIVCPRGKLRWDTPSEPEQRRYYFPAAGNGASASAWLQREVDAAVRALETNFPTRVTPGPVLYIGFSQGAILGASLLIQAPRRFPRAILVEGGHGAWSAESARTFARGGGQRVLFACGRQSCDSSARRAAAELLRAGVAVKVVYAPDQGHTYDAKVQEQVAAQFDWVLAGDERPTAPDVKKGGEPSAATPPAVAPPRK